MHASELWESDSIGPRLARLALSPLSLIYAIGWEAYLGVYRLGLKRAKEPHRPVVCVGNLVSGGSGKTPATLHVAQVLADLGHSVVLSASGYGSPGSEAATLIPEGPLDPSEWGDEPALYRELLPAVPIIVGRRRVLAAEICAREFPDAVLLMDDGFQHLPLRKHLSMILDSPEPENRMCLPAGPYREPRWNRRRADLVLPGQFRMEEQSIRIDRRLSGQAVALPSAASFLCALGQPGRVLTAIRDAGIKVENHLFMPDHDTLDGPELLSNFPPNLPILVTAKDWMKLRKRPDVDSREFLVLDHRVIIEPADEFKRWIGEKLHGIQTASHSGSGKHGGV